MKKGCLFVVAALFVANSALAQSRVGPQTATPASADEKWGDRMRASQAPSLDSQPKNTVMSPYGQVVGDRVAEEVEKLFRYDNRFEPRQFGGVFFDRQSKAVVIIYSGSRQKIDDAKESIEAMWDVISPNLNAISARLGIPLLTIANFGFVYVNNSSHKTILAREPGGRYAME